MTDSLNRKRQISDLSEDLEGHRQVQESRIINHPEYYKPVLLTRYGWAKRGGETHWYKQEIQEIGEGKE